MKRAKKNINQKVTDVRKNSIPQIYIYSIIIITDFTNAHKLKLIKQTSSALRVREDEQTLKILHRIYGMMSPTLYHMNICM